MILKYLPFAGIISFVYFIIIVLYIGLQNGFSFIWLLLSCLFFFLPKLNQLRLKWFGESALSHVLKWGFVAGALLAVTIFVIVSAMILSGMTQKEQPGYSYIIVLGARVKGEIPSHALQMRLDKAYAYLAANPETKAVLSGAQGNGEDISEAECMKRYLLSMNIEEERLILEDQSTSTHENLSFSAQKIDDIQARIGIISNNFHIYRSVKLAEKLGYTDAHGVAAKTMPAILPHYFVREVLAVIKDKAVGNIG